MTSRNQQSPSKNSQYQSIPYIEWHSTRHSSVNATKCIQTQTLTIQSANKAKLLYYIFNDCPVVTQNIQTLQPTVMITYLPLHSDKVCSPPSLPTSLVCTTVNNDGYKDVFTDIWQATGLKHPDMYTGLTEVHKMMCSATHGKQFAWSITKCGRSETITLQYIQNRAVEAWNHRLDTGHSSHSRNASPIMQGTTMIHYQLQSCNLAACNFYFFLLLYDQMKGGHS